MVRSDFLWVPYFLKIDILPHMWAPLCFDMIPETVRAEFPKTLHTHFSYVQGPCFEQLKRLN